jgi:hypothetical protein
MSDRGIELVYLGEATVQDEIVQTWTEAKEKVTSLLTLKLRSVSATPEQGRAMEEGRPLIARDEVAEAEARYEYWRKAQNFMRNDFFTEDQFRVWVYSIGIVSFFVCLVFFRVLYDLIPGVLALLISILIPFFATMCLAIFAQRAISAIGMHRAKNAIKAAKDRARAPVEAMAMIKKETPEVINVTLKATRFWAKTRCEALHNLLVADDAPEVRKKVIPAFAKVLKATESWEKAESMCHQVVVNMKDRSRIAKEALRILEAVVVNMEDRSRITKETLRILEEDRSRIAKEAPRILEAVTAAETVSREAEKMFYQAISHTTIPTHNDSTENKSDFVIEKQ